MAVGIAKLVIGILGNVIASVFFASPVLTFWRIVRKGSVENFSGLPYVGCVANCSTWTFYGLPLVIEGGLLVMTINGAATALNLIFVILFLIFSTGKERRKVSMLFLAVVVFLGVLISVNLAVVPKHDRRKVIGSVGIFINILMYAAPLSNTKLVIQTSSVEYVPFFFTLMAFINASVWTVYAVLTSDIFIMTPNVMGTALGFCNLLLYALYYNADPKQFMESDLEAEKIRQQELQPQHPADVNKIPDQESIVVSKQHPAC